MNDTHLLNERAFSTLPSACRMQERASVATASKARYRDQHPASQHASRPCCWLRVLTAHPGATPQLQPGSTGWTSCPPSETRLRLLPNLTLQPLPQAVRQRAPSHLSCSQKPHEMLQPRAARRGCFPYSPRAVGGEAGKSALRDCRARGTAQLPATTVQPEHLPANCKLQAARDEAASALQD